MRSVINQRSLPVLCAVLAVLATGAGAACATEGNETGIRNVQLSSYYNRSPISVSPGAPSYSLPIQLGDIANADDVCETLHLDANAKEAVERNGFVVVSATNPMGEMYDDVVAPYEQLSDFEVPVFVTSDSLLHVYHVLFDEILKCVEEKEFYGKLLVMTRALFDESLRQYDAFSGDLKEAARRNVAFFAVARKLLGDEIVVPDCVSAEVADEIAKIEAHEGFSESAIFIYREDYSQYVPRGHYTRSETLQKYFKGMMWYGRMAFLLKGHADWGPMGEALVSVRDARIQTVQASLMTLALDSLEAEGGAIAEIWNRIYAVTAFFVGLADDLTPYQYKEAILKILGSPVNFEDFNDENKMFELKAELALLPSPKIYGGTGFAFVFPPLTPEKLDEVLDKSKGMRLMGQRFIPDSYMFQNLVAPVVGQYLGEGKPFTMEYTAGGPTRCFPRGLDVMAVLGSEEALTILERDGDTDYVNYDKSVNDLIALFETFTEEDWNRNLYWGWLYTLKALLEKREEGYPAFMRGTPWKDKQLSTALASWTELRHDTILYAKQSYTPPIGSVPELTRGYVEPIPEFFNRLLSLTRMTRTGLSDMNVLDQTQRERLQALEAILSRLLGISIAELEGTELSESDYVYIKEFAQALKPLLTDLSDEKGPSTTLIADVHTDSNTSQVLEEGVGYVKFMAVAYMLPDSTILLGTGPIFSYYEFKWPMADRLTDEKWTEMLGKEENPPPPDWVRSFVHPVTFFPEREDDADRDELPDSWETSIWGNTDEVNDPDGDYDNDGCTNEEERVAGTNPDDPESCLRVLSIQPDETGAALSWASTAGKRYRISYSDDLVTWYLLGTPVGCESETADASDPATQSTTRRFYRINVIP